MIEDTIRRIEKLFEMEPSSSVIARGAGLNQPVVNRYQNGVMDLTSIQLGNAQKLENYYLQRVQEERLKGENNTNN